MRGFASLPPVEWSPRLKSTVQLAHRIAALAAEKLATDIVILDMRDVVSYTDHFIICTGPLRQTQAISDAIRESLKRDDKRSAQRVEGQAQGDWILIDYLDVVTHIFTPRHASSTGSSRCGGRYQEKFAAG